MRTFRSASRVATLDIVRGIALLGIFTINLPDMAYPEDLVLYPDGTANGGALDYWVLLLSEILFAGKMRALFAVAFGASAVLFVESLARTYESTRVRSIYCRRLLWLGVFGLFNAYVLLWWGDILFQYAVLGFLLFPLIDASRRVLAAIALGCLALLALQPALEYRDVLDLEEAYQAVRSNPQQVGHPLDPGIPDVVEAWRQAEAERIPDPEYIAEEVSARSGGYLAAFVRNSRVALEEQTFLFAKEGVADILLYMLLGIVLARTGLSGVVRWKRAHLAASIGLITFGLVAETWVDAGYLQNYLDPVKTAFLRMFSELGRLPLVVGYLLLILIVFEKGSAGRLGQALGATGRMALTNYLTQSIVGALLFTGFGFAKFNALSRLELVAILCSVWFLQVAFSVIWMRFFYNGPFEWLWRSLTYWRLQPLIRQEAAGRW